MCKYYAPEYVERKKSVLGRYVLRQHKVVGCSNPNGSMFDTKANCYLENPNWKTDSIRKSRFPTATVEKMRTTKEVNKMVKLKVKESISIEDGLHTGKVDRIEYRTDPYEYTDVIVKLDDKDVELKYGCPTNLSTTSKLGRLLSIFGELKVGAEVDIDKALIGKKVQFQTVTEKTPKGEFARIIGESIKKL